ncbi:MAG: MBL fold metallo-hydrolase [Zetaproteobacteria bacterium]|nr:MAG: MBL fold metallo-hydrolase [Zetaproteobacteria bacterium]
MGSQALRVCVLVNDATRDEPWLAEHGVAFWVETIGGGRPYRFLFDTGRTAQVLAHNACAMNVDWATAEAVVISHGHNDHTGGLLEALRGCGRRVPVILHPDALLPKLKTVPVLRAIGPPYRWDQVERTGFLLPVRDPVHLVAGVQTSGEIPRTTAFEGSEEFQTLRDGRVEPDDLRDDLALFVHLPDVGLVVVTGCAHAGIVNTIRHGLALTGATRLRAVIGGFHLIRATPDRIRQTVEALHALQPEILAPIHCTGDHAVAELSRAFGDRVRYAYVGSQLRIESDGSVTI